MLDLDAAFASIAPTMPGCAAGVAIDGAAPVIRGYGLADLEHPVPIAADTVFETGSLAKQFTAAAMLLLVQDGKLTLDDDIRRYLPEMPDYGVPITIRHLLTHSSGLREQWSLLALTGNGPGTQVHDLSTILDLASRQKGLNFAPGAEYLYTNTNYALAAIIVERASGMSLQRFTEERLFRPLGMRHSRWREDFRTVVPGRAMAYASGSEGFIANMPFTNVYGNGGLLTTIADLLRWNAFLDRPSDLPGGEALVAALQTPGKLRNGTPLEYGLGLEITRAHGLRLIAHSGSTAGYKAWLGRYPEKHVSVALLCNNGDVDSVALGEGIAEQALRAAGYVERRPVVSASLPTTSPIGPAGLDPARYQGLFRDPVTGELAATTVVDGELALQRGSTQRLSPMGKERFRRADGGVAQFVRENGKPVELVLGNDRRGQRFVAVAPAIAGPAALDAYVGTYYSAELDRRISVVRNGNRLVMRQPFAVEWPLTPRFADGFTTRLRGTSSFVFARAPDGKIDGFSAWVNGARNIWFVRQP
ncbi:serine hydrolase domain-containing protein [Sphingomonas sp. NPDC092331]|jgi:CubicO group peptidase (beta-lactamase class C family)|nr:serine hydrolase [Pseudomonadota bacterium]